MCSFPGRYRVSLRIQGLLEGRKHVNWTSNGNLDFEEMSVRAITSVYYSKSLYHVPSKPGPYFCNYASTISPMNSPTNRATHLPTLCPKVRNYIFSPHLGIFKVPAIENEPESHPLPSTHQFWLFVLAFVCTRSCR